MSSDVRDIILRSQGSPNCIWLVELIAHGHGFAEITQSQRERGTVVTSGPSREIEQVYPSPSAPSILACCRRSSCTHPARHSRVWTRLLSGPQRGPRSVSETHGYLNSHVNLVAHESVMYHRIREGRYDAESVRPHEARHWHRQAYGGFGEIRALSSRDIGHAAAYTGGEG